MQWLAGAGAEPERERELSGAACRTGARSHGRLAASILQQKRLRLSNSRYPDETRMRIVASLKYHQDRHTLAMNTSEGKSMEVKSIHGMWAIYRFFTDLVP